MVPRGVDFAREFSALSESGQKEKTITVGGMNVRFVRLAAGTGGEWGSHDGTAETAIVWSGDFTVEFRDTTLQLAPGQCCVVAPGAEHKGSTQGGAEIILLTQA
jgi:mannose-6-phosphate isomerase-like protein (cupin superfamily)